jgi:hypothetical protein
MPTGFGAVAQVAAGRSHACALSTAGAVACWGSATTGQIGQLTNSPTAISVDFGATAVALAAGGDTTCIFTSNGTQRCVGTNSYGQMGLGTSNAQASNPTAQQALPAAGASVALGPATPPAFVTVTKGAQTCSIRLSVSIGITCGWLPLLWRGGGKGGRFSFPGGGGVGATLVRGGAECGFFQAFSPPIRPNPTEPPPGPNTGRRLLNLAAPTPKTSAAAM